MAEQGTDQTLAPKERKEALDPNDVTPVSPFPGYTIGERTPSMMEYFKLFLRLIFKPDTFDLWARAYGMKQSDSGEKSGALDGSDAQKAIEAQQEYFERKDKEGRELNEAEKEAIVRKHLPERTERFEEEGGSVRRLLHEMNEEDHDRKPNTHDTTMLDTTMLAGTSKVEESKGEAPKQFAHASAKPLDTTSEPAPALTQDHTT